MISLQQVDVGELASDEWTLLARGVSTITKRIDGKEKRDGDKSFFEFGDSPLVRVRIFGAEDVPVGDKITASIRLFGKFQDFLTEHFALVAARIDYHHVPTLSRERTSRMTFHTQVNEYKPKGGDRHWYVDKGVIVWR